MKRIYLSFLLSNVLLPLPRTSVLCNMYANACYSISKDDCDFVRLVCDESAKINIVSANYGFTAECNNTVGCVNKSDCCVLSTGYSITNYTFDHLQALTNTCLGMPYCKVRAVIARLDGNFHSNTVAVTYNCEPGVSPKTNDGTTSSNKASNDSENGNTAAIVVPIVVVLLIVIAATVFFFWRRKRQTEKRTYENQGNQTLCTPVANPGYCDTDKTTGVSIAEADNEDPENTYHTIDPASIPDRAIPNDYLILEPETEYNVIDSKGMDRGQKTVNEYSSLQTKVPNIREENTDSDYNKLSLKANGIEKDPNYQRLGTVDHTSIAKGKEQNPDYSHINGIKLTTDGKEVENKKITEDLDTNEKANHDYFILEPEDQTTNKEECRDTDYNKLN